MSERHLKVVGALLGLLVALLLLRLGTRDDVGGTIDAGAGFSLDLVAEPTRIDILRLTMGDTIRLERDGLAWRVDGHPADSAKVADLLPALDEARATDLVARNPDNHEALGVSDATGRRIELYTDAGGPVAFHLGNRDRGRGGYYVRAPGAPEVYRLDGPVGGYLGRARDDWRDRLIATLDTAALRAILIRRRGDEVTLVRDEDGWRVGDAPADTSAVRDLLLMLATLSASSTFPSDAEAAAADFTRPDGALDVFSVGEGDITARSLVLSLRFVQTQDEGGRWLVRRADDRETYGLTAASIRRLLPERSRLSPGEGGDTSP